MNHSKHLQFLRKICCGRGMQNAFVVTRMDSSRKKAIDDASNVQNIERDARNALARGDRATVGTVLMRGYGDRIFRYCMTVLADRRDAEDAVQQVFLNAFEYMDTFEGNRHFLAWLLGIATHRCTDILRKNGRWHRRFAVGRPIPDDPDPRPSADELLTYKWYADEVDRCIDRAPPRYRIELALRFREGLTYAEMAEILKEPASRLQIRISRLMRTFRIRLTLRGVRP